MNFYIFISLLSINLLPPLIFTGLATVYILINLRKSGNKYLNNIIVIPVIVFIIGLINSNNNELYNIGKDIWYFCNPIIAIIFGYIFIQKCKNIDVYLKTIVFSGFIISIFHIIKVLLNLDLFQENYSIVQVREAGGSGYVITLLSLSLIIFYYKANYFKKHRLLTHIIILSLTFSLFISFSRTLWSGFFIFMIFGMQIFKYESYKSLLKITIPIGVLMLFLNFVPAYFTDVSSILSKFSYSIEEILIRDYYSQYDISNHWRGYESLMAINTFNEQNLFSKLVGGGFGKLIDLKIYMSLGETTYRFIPILHNGYLYVLVKTGLIGVCLHILYFTLFLKAAVINNEKEKKHSRVLVAIIIYLLFSSLVIGGMFNIDNLSVMFLLGSLLFLIKNPNNENNL